MYAKKSPSKKGSRALELAPKFRPDRFVTRYFQPVESRSSRFAPRPFSEPAHDKDYHANTEPHHTFNFSEIDIFPRETTVQPKLKLGPAGDRYEREADLVARKVVSTISKTGRDPIQRQDLEEDEEEELMMKRDRTGLSFNAGGGWIEPGLESAIQGARGGGQPLSDGVRRPMEQAFGADFGGVRLHTDEKADRLNRSIQARAFTTGQDIFLRQGEYQPGSSDGQRLLAHELTHVVQQNGGAVQRMVETHRDVTTEPERTQMNKLANFLDNCVQMANQIINGKPTLEGVEGNDKGYLKSWVETFNIFTKTGDIPDFFFARYGYAVETIATGLFERQSIAPYKGLTQVAHGHTRPDVVISKPSNEEIAWLDITSSNSKGHILRKQSSLWNTRPYVAEILYKMPDPMDFATTATQGLSKQQLAALKSANQARVQQEIKFDRGMKMMGTILSNAYTEKSKEKLLSKQDVKDITIKECQKVLAPEVTPSVAAGVLASIESIDVGEDSGTGESWAKWAFIPGPNFDRAAGRNLLLAYGQRLPT